MRCIDETGNRYGRLSVIKRSPVNQQNGSGEAALWICKCDCGKTSVVAGYVLRRGHTNSCGCLRKESLSARDKIMWAEIKKFMEER